MMIQNPVQDYCIYVLNTRGPSVLRSCLQALKRCIGGSGAVVRVVSTNPVDAAREMHSGRSELPQKLEWIAMKAGDLPFNRVFAQALAHARRSGGLDVLVMADCVEPVPFFDVRLAWSAHRFPYAAAVSPLCALDPLTSPVPYGLVEEDLVARMAATDAILAHTAGIEERIEVPGFLPECVYLRRDFLAALEGPRFEPADLLLAARRGGWAQMVAPHLLVGLAGCPPRAVSWAQSVFEELGQVNTIRHFLDCAPYEATLRAFYRLRESSAPPALNDRLRRRNLHVMHSWGGGLNHFVRLYCQADEVCRNFLLKSMTDPTGSTGIALALYGNMEDAEPMASWNLPAVIRGTAVAHAAYAAILRDIIAEHAIDALMISSFIGHSLDLLRTSLDTTIILHEYYPFCPALYISFDGVCRDCDEQRLKACFAANPMNYLFSKSNAEEWLTLRKHYVELLHWKASDSDRGALRLVAPSPSVYAHYSTLLPELELLPHYVIPHGDGLGDQSPRRSAETESVSIRKPSPRRAVGAAGEFPEGHELPWDLPPRSDRLRVAVLGRVFPAKGEAPLGYLLEHLSASVEFCMIGCGQEWAAKNRTGFLIIADYASEQLPAILREVAPDACLFLSVWPETFSFTLQECFASGVPPIAPRLGAFADRITDGVDGILVDPAPEAFQRVLEGLLTDRDRLRPIRAALAGFAPKTARAMVAEYEQVMARPVTSERTYFSRVAVSQGGFVSETVEHRLTAAKCLEGIGPIPFGEYLLQTERDCLRYVDDNRGSLGCLAAVVTLAIRLWFAPLRGLNRIRERWMAPKT